MASGKFSKPRPDREEERQIEQAFRQVTGQEEPVSSIPEPVFEEVPPSAEPFFEPDLLSPEPAPELPEEQEPVDFIDKATVFLTRVMDYCSQNRKVVLVSLCAIALVTIMGFIGAILVSSADPYDKTILNNVMIADVNVGGMTKEDAIRAVEQSVAFSDNDMIVDLAGTELRLAAEKADISLNVKAAVNAAYDYGRTGTKAEQEQAYMNSLLGNHIIGLLPYLELNEDYIRQMLDDYAAGSGSSLTQATHRLEGQMPDLTDKDFDPASKAPVLVIHMGVPGIHFDTDAVYEQILDAYSLHRFQVSIQNVDTVAEPEPVDLEAIYQEICVEPVNASVDLRNYKVIPGTYGCTFDLEDARAMIEKAYYGEDVRIPMVYAAPDILNEDMFFQDVLSEYKNAYQGAVLEKNLQTACKALDGTVINPGEEFSFNEVLGERTSDKGYRYAKDVTGLEETTSLGGGISQVSSVLYYCALVADLEVTHRTSHKLIPGYSDYGLDAMVGWRTPDFRFENNTSFPIRIEAAAVAGQLKISIVGTDERDYHVAMDYDITATVTPKTEYRDYKADNKEGYKDGDVIREGVKGYSVKTYKLKYDNASGELISRDFVASTTYQSLSKLVARVAEPEETTEATEDTTPTETTAPETQPEQETTTPTVPTVPTDPPATVPTEPVQTKPPATEPSTPEETKPRETTPPASETTQPSQPPAASQQTEPVPSETDVSDDPAAE